jgi:hypothetical protein
MLVAAVCSIVGDAFGGESAFEFPGAFRVSAHGTLYVTIPSGWKAQVVYPKPDKNPENIPSPPPTPLLVVSRETQPNRVFIDLLPFDVSRKGFVIGARSVTDRDPQGNPVPRTSIIGPHVKGTICSPPKNHPKNYFRSHGDLETGDIFISFSTAIDDTNDWSQVQTVLESVRFEGTTNNVQPSPSPYAKPGAAE